ncbi:Protein NLRC5 [Holothuria leucospilota]|uniref:Protein NLRC5 n=1 Tax=Holothuria leucospilota TaxID=206669 RepID=A0A9Q1H4Y5_HOLLE|nr:Protein NLRC5 [Holothuria leucospilota]
MFCRSSMSIVSYPLENDGRQSNGQAIRKFAKEPEEKPINSVILQINRTCDGLSLYISEYKDLEDLGTRLGCIMYLFSILIFVVRATVANEENVAGQFCKSQQFLELGKTGYIECFFTKPFFGIFWFDSLDHVNNVPIAMLKDSVKSGDGYQAGEYDINPHGSLIITEVSPLHEKSFTVYKLETVDSKIEPIFINVVVYAFPNPLHPIINDCLHQQCVVEIPYRGSLRCAVNGIRPIVKLSWKMAHEDPLHAITFYGENYTIETNGDVYDVMLTSRFVVNDTSVSRLNVECGIVLEERDDLFNLTSEAHLLLLTVFFSDPYFKGKTFVLEGESGCGQSTFAQQLAYDWCIKPNVSPQQCVEILILLPFRQFGNMTSMCEAIKKIYFPEHSDIDEEVLQSILSESSHVLIILDGYDEYPQVISDPRKIVQTSTSQKKHNFTLIITSRSCLEEGSISNDNQQVSLIACTTSVRDTSSFEKEEIKDVKGIKRMESYLETNPFVACLCSFPLFFLLADVLSFEENNVQSVSGFLEEIIQSVDRLTSDLSSVQTFEDSYRKLGGEVFRKMGLQDKNDNCVWLKEDISKIIDSECFKMLLQSSILVEEKVTSGDFTSAFYVKFCHSIFHEWFSAIYIANKIKSDDNYNMDFLREDLSFYKPVYYFYVFLLKLREQTVCEKLMKILEKRENFREFLILFKRNTVEYKAEAEELIESYVSENINF